MKKSDLRSGMIVEDRRGQRGIVLLNAERHGDIVGGGMAKDKISETERTWSPLRSWDENLRYVGPCGKDRSRDIVKIWSPNSNKHAGSFDLYASESIWERPRGMTHKQIEEALGREFEYIADE
jgi:hypothetical protein